jgi:hypothetical protein
MSNIKFRDNPFSGSLAFYAYRQTGGYSELQGTPQISDGVLNCQGYGNTA